MVTIKELWKSTDIEVYVTMTKKFEHADGTKGERMVRKKEIDVGYIDYPVEVFVNKKLVFSTETVKQESENI